MSEIRKPRKQCGRKLRFDTELDARLGLVEHHGYFPDFNVYWCPHCEFWHFGHKQREDA